MVALLTQSCSNRKTENDWSKDGLQGEVLSFSEFSFEAEERFGQIEKGRSQKWLALKIGRSYNMVIVYVQNRQQPRLEILNDIANILDVDIKDLIVSNKK